MADELRDPVSGVARLQLRERRRVRPSGAQASVEVDQVVSFRRRGRQVEVHEVLPLAALNGLRECSFGNEADRSNATDRRRQQDIGDARAVDIEAVGQRPLVEDDGVMMDPYARRLPAAHGVEHERQRQHRGREVQEKVVAAAGSLDHQTAGRGAQRGVGACDQRELFMQRKTLLTPGPCAAGHDRPLEVGGVREL